MWSSIPFDLLAKVFFFLSPDSLARASSVCHHWHTCIKLYSHHSTPPHHHHHHRAWFLAFPSRDRRASCYVHNLNIDTWHELSMDFSSGPIRPVSSVGNLLLVRPTNSTFLKFALCNPFTRQFRYLPLMNIARTNPAVGVIIVGQAQQGPFPDFRIYVAGGMSKAPYGSAAAYESTLEKYDSRQDTWQIVGPMPPEFAVRLTVWTPDESVYVKGILYWVTSARAYSIMGFEIESNTWRELSVPMADRLEFAALASRRGRLTLIGGAGDGDACVWEINEDDDTWRLTEKVPNELGTRLLGGKLNWGSTKCVGIDGAIWLYKEIGLGMIAWREVGDEGKWEWNWVDGCCVVRGRQVQNIAIKGVLIHPSLALYLQTF